MNYLKLIFISALGLVAGLGVVRAETTVIEDFNSYVGGDRPVGVGPYYIQLQNTAWSRSGAISDGIYSIAGGVAGTRGANFSMNWAAGGAARVKYDFASPQAYSVGVVFSLDLLTSVALPETTVVGVITDSANTTWQTTAVQSVSNTSYATYSFSFTNETTLRTGGPVSSLVASLMDVKSITVQFVNGSGAGSQTIAFDNLSVTTSAIPEPGSFGLIMAGVAGLACFNSASRRRRDRVVIGG